MAPVCFYVAGTLLGGTGAGLALAWAYRAVNTADAMIGYRRDELEYLGRATARTDDALNYLPARLTAATIVAGAWLARQGAHREPERGPDHGRDGGGGRGDAREGGPLSAGRRAAAGSRRDRSRAGRDAVGRGAGPGRGRAASPARALSNFFARP